MMNQQHSHYSHCFFTICIIIIITTSHVISPSLCISTDPKLEALIKQICGQTEDFGFCSNTLNKNLNPSVKDLAGLTELTVKLALAYSNEVDLFVQNAIGREKNQQVKQLYQGCERNYDVVVRSLKSARIYADGGDYTKMVASLNQCTRPVIDCQSAISGYVPEMLDRNRKMRVFLNMGLYEGKIIV